MGRGRVGTRAGLIAAALLVQGVVLSAGWLFTFRVVQRSFAREIEGRVIDQNRDLAGRIAALFPEGDGGAIEFDSPGWERLQRIIEGDALRELPAGGFACLIEADGRLLCHPEIRRSPGLRNFSFDGKPLLESLEAGARSAPLLDAGGERGASGLIEFTAGDFHYVATRTLPGSSLRLLVHQPVDALVRVGRQGTRWVMGVAAVAVLGVLGVTGAGLGVLLRRYDSVHEVLNRQMRDNLLLARRVQEGTLPDAIPSLPGFDIAGWCAPAEETGGDTFDVVPLPGIDGPACGIEPGAPARRAGLLLADATGHGIGPALAVTQLHAMTRLAWRLGGSALDVARLANEQLARSLPEGRFVTALFAVADAGTGVIEFVSAGQGPILVWRDATGEAERVAACTYPLGVIDVLGVDRASRSALGPGDIFCVVSDGILEAVDASGAPFGWDRLVELVRDARAGSASEIAGRIRDAVARHAGDAPPLDDQTVLVVRRTGAA